MSPRFRTALTVTVALVGIVIVRFDAQSQGKTVDWRYFGGDKAFPRYSPADQITRDNVKNLRIVWRRPAETELPSGTTGAPMTYMHRGKQYIVVPVGAKDHPAEFVALALTDGRDTSAGDLARK